MSIDKEKLKRIFSKISTAATIGWLGFNAWNKDIQYKKANSQKDVLQAEVKQLRTVVSEVAYRVSMDNFEIDDIPFPMCYKIYDDETDAFYMVKVNEAYASRYDVSNIRYFGQKDSQVYGDKIGNQYKSNDFFVYSLPEGQVHEFFENYKSRDGSAGIGKYYKWKVKKGGRIYIYLLEII